MALPTYRPIVARRRVGSFRSYIKAKRKEAGLSRPRLAAIMEVHPNVIAFIESGQTKQPELVTIAELGKALHLDFNEVMTFFGAPRLEGRDRLATAMERRPLLQGVVEEAVHLGDGSLAYLLVNAKSYRLQEREKDRLDAEVADGHDN